MLRDHCILLGKWVAVGRVSTDVPRGNKGVTKLLAIRSRPETDGIHPWTLDIFLGTRLSSSAFENSWMQTVSGERIIGLSPLLWRKKGCKGNCERLRNFFKDGWRDSGMNWNYSKRVGYLRIGGIFARKIVLSKEGNYAGMEKMKIINFNIISLRLKKIIYQGLK